VSIKELISEFEKSYQDVVNKPIDWSSMDSVRATNYYLYDDADTARLKFFINHIMSRKDITEEIVDALFIRYCSDEANFCKSLYMFEKEIRLLHEHDLFSIGIHTHTHSNVVKEKKDVFISEIVKNQNILSEQLGIQSQGIAYPFGAVTRELYEEKIEKGVESLGLTYGLTTEEKINKDFNNPFLLGRFNSEDITHGKKPEFSV
jgi:peptidoglycan/xylan/chitin deacetylase (PgdA/CDA1 family)